MANLPVRRCTLLSLAVALSMQPVESVEAETGLALEEIIVTARRHAESLQDAPLAVSVLTGEVLRDVGITNLADITERVPNLQISRPSRNANVYIRGLGPTRGSGNVTELSVGVYVDDVFLLKPHGQIIDLAEVESIQVLRGPQGTLFGKNTTGGALVLTTVKPAPDFGGFARLSAGNDGRFNAQAGLDMPLRDGLLGKLTVSRVRADGFFRDPVHGTELSDENRLGGLLQMRWLASTRITADFSLYYNRIRENSLALGDCVVTNPEAQVPARALITPVSGFRRMSDFCEAVNAQHGGVAPYHDVAAKFSLDAAQASLNLNWELAENHKLKSVTAWREQQAPDTSQINPYVGFPAGERALEDGNSRYFSQEYQLSGDFAAGVVAYTLGLYYMKEDSDNGTKDFFLGERGIWGSVDAAVPVGQVAALTNVERTGLEIDNTTRAAYAQLRWDVTDRFELTAGLRYGREQRKLTTHRAEGLPPHQAYADLPGALHVPGTASLLSHDSFFNESPSVLPLPLGPTQWLAADEDFESLTPMLSIAYRFPEQAFGNILDGLMLYASYTEGYKAGGFSDFAQGELVPFDEEQIDSIELGAKVETSDNRLRVNAAFFSMRYRNMQLFVARPDPHPTRVGYLQGVTNAGESTIDGAEVEVTWVPAEGWTIDIAASLADGSFEEFDDYLIDPVSRDAIPLDRADEDLPSLPENSLGLGVQYQWNNRFGDWLMRFDAFHRDRIYWGFDALTWDLPLAREHATTNSVTVFNGRLKWVVNDRLSLAIWGRNLSNEVYFDGGVGEQANLGHVTKIFSPPRRYGVDLHYSF